MQLDNINLSSIILLAIGLTSIVFTIWNRISWNRYIRQVRPNGNGLLSDEKYFELKSKQDFIIAISSVIVSLAVFFGYQDLKSIREGFEKEFQAEKKNLAQIKSEAKGALSDYRSLKAVTHVYSDSVRTALNDLATLKMQLKAISLKNIIQQNIYIVEKVDMGRFKADDSMYRTIYYKDLVTINGEKLPKFSAPPSILCTSPTQSWPLLKNVTFESFRINVENSLSHGEPLDTEHILVDFWISQKPANTIR